MTKLIVRIEASECTIDLDEWKEEYFDDDKGGWHMDWLYDDFVHEIVTRPEYTVEVVDEA